MTTIQADAPPFDQIKPDDTPQRDWDAMTPEQRAVDISDDLRPSDVMPHRWRAMSRKDRAAAAMHAKTEEWDWRGSLSGSKAVSIPLEDLTIVARTMLALGEGELEQLLRRARRAAGPG